MSPTSWILALASAISVRSISGFTRHLPILWMMKMRSPNQIGVKNLTPVSGWDKNAYSRRHEGRLVVDNDTRQVEQLVVKSAEVDQDEIVYGTTRGDRLSGGSDRDQLLGGAGNDRLLGGSDDDILVGGTGADQLWGGSGRDRFDFSAGDGGSTLAEADVIYDFLVGGSLQNAEIIGLGAGLKLENLVIEAGLGEYAGDTIVRYGDEFLARLVGVGFGEFAIAQNVVQLP
ncbi:MAG: hypothetical protein HC857_16510 [Synechococcales cyanobacterium RU_4_20]|nr:hypothetical protein [Synechococcales cyanobacterium RU_4_20]